MKIDNPVVEKSKGKNLPIIVKKIFIREDFSMGSLERSIKDQGGIILRIGANYKHWHVVIKF